MVKREESKIVKITCKGVVKEVTDEGIIVDDEKLGEDMLVFC